MLNSHNQSLTLAFIKEATDHGFSPQQANEALTKAADSLLDYLGFNDSVDRATAHAKYLDRVGLAPLAGAGLGAALGGVGGAYSGYKATTPGAGKDRKALATLLAMGAGGVAGGVGGAAAGGALATGVAPFIAS